MPSALNMFSDWTDIFHFILGIFAAFSLVYIHRLVSVSVVLAFLFYESIQEEEQETSVCDLVEFICGFLVGVVFTW